MTTVTSFPRADIRRPLTRAGVRNALFSHPIVSLGFSSRPSSVNSLKFGKSSCNIALYRSSGGSRNNSRSRSFVVRCQASGGRMTEQDFTEMAWQAVASTPELAKENKHQIVETEHLMKALLEQKNGLARRIFSKAGVDNARLLEATDKYIQRQPKQGEIPLTEDEDEEQRQPLLEDSRLGPEIDCGSESSKNQSLASNWGKRRLYYLEERDEEALSKRILALSQTNRRESSLTLFMSMEFAGLRPNLHACNSLLSCLSRNNMVDDLLRVFSFMKHNKIVSGHSCSIVLKALANSHGSDSALKLFSEWQAEKEMGQHFDAIVYNTVISICGKENKCTQMKRIWKSLKKSEIAGTEVTYRVLVCTFVRCGQYDFAIDAYNELLQNGVKPGYDAMHAVIGACMKEEKWDLAVVVFLSMLKCGLKPNLIACNALINTLGKAGKVIEAFKVYKHMISLGHTPDSYTWNALLGAFYRANKYANALLLFESLQNNHSIEPNLHLYNTALMCCQRLGFWDKALQFLWKMENSGLSVSTTSYNIVISACEVARKPKVALQVYERSVHRNCSPDTFTYLSLVRSCIWGDLWKEVEDILDESMPDVSLYNAAIHGMCLRGRIESAKKLYMKMRDIGLTPDGKTRALMLQYLQKD